MLLDRQRGSPESHQAVASVFVEGALVRDDRFGQAVEEVARQVGRVFHRQRFDLAGIAFHVGDEGRHVELARAQRVFNVAAKQLFDHFRRNVLAQGVEQVARAALRLLPLVGYGKGEQEQVGRQRRRGGKVRVVTAGEVRQYQPRAGNGAQHADAGHG